MQETTTLRDEFRRLPTEPVAALRVLAVIDDPRASATHLAHVVEADPALSARVMRLANAPYYGLTRRVSSASHAVVLLGFTTVRALAVGAACGLLADRGPIGPAGFWGHAVATATASSVIARHAGVPSPDAFSAGLLHDVGSSLFYRFDPERYEQDIAAQGNWHRRLRAEESAFGATHAHAAAEVLGDWRFPTAFVEAVARHHSRPETVREPLARTIIAGESLAAATAYHAGCEPVCSLDDALAALGLEGVDVDALVADATAEIDAVNRRLGVFR